MELTGGFEKSSFREVVRVLVMEWENRDWTTGCMQDFQGCLPKKDGETKWVLVKGTSYFNMGKLAIYLEADVGNNSVGREKWTM